MGVYVALGLLWTGLVDLIVVYFDGWFVLVISVVVVVVCLCLFAVCFAAFIMIGIAIF